jgi:hypothetical protein
VEQHVCPEAGAGFSPHTKNRREAPSALPQAALHTRQAKIDADIPEKPLQILIIIQFRPR